MFRVGWKKEDGRIKLLFKTYPTGIEFGDKGEICFLEVESSTLKKFIDNIVKDSRIKVN